MTGSQVILEIVFSFFKSRSSSLLRLPGMTMIFYNWGTFIICPLSGVMTTIPLLEAKALSAIVHLRYRGLSQGYGAGLDCTVYIPTGPWASD